MDISRISIKKLKTEFLQPFYDSHILEDVYNEISIDNKSITVYDKNKNELFYIDHYEKMFIYDIGRVFNILKRLAKDKNEHYIMDLIEYVINNQYKLDNYDASDDYLD